MTHEGEMRTHQELASYLGFSSREAALVRTSVERRFHELHDRKKTVSGWKDAAMAAVSASGLDHYLHAATGLTTMNLFLSPFHLQQPQRELSGSSPTDEARLSRARSEWILAPALVAGALFVADRAETEDERRLLVAAVSSWPPSTSPRSRVDQPFLSGGGLNRKQMSADSSRSQ